jgi:hypothetical protein
VFEKVFGPMQPNERRLFVRVGVPGMFLFLLGSGLAIAGETTRTPALMAVGFPVLGVGFIAWAMVVYQLTRKGSPQLMAWQRARVEGATANKFNTVVCSAIVIVGVVTLIESPSAFSLAFVVSATAMLVFFARRGWPRRNT